MKHVSVSEFRANPKKYLDEMRAGETFLIGNNTAEIGVLGNMQGFTEEDRQNLIYASENIESVKSTLDSFKN